MQKRIGLLVILFLCLFVNAYAQTGAIKGFVYDKASGEAMNAASISIEGTKMAVQTDINGYFSIAQIPEGVYNVYATVIGYDSVKVSINIKPGQIVSKKIFIGVKGVELKGVEVSARKTQKLTNINAGMTTVTPREMKLMPSAGGEPDIAQYLQVVPGVVFTGDQGGQLYIRGGAPSQTGILLDGVTIYNPFHSIGLYSVFETDAIRSVDIQTAGFNAQYGNRTSAILDVHTKDGNKNRLSGKLSASPIMARALLEGPLSKPKQEGSASTTFLISAKHSYLNQTSKSLYGGFGEPYESGLPYAFTDLYGKVTFNADNGSKLNLFGFSFDDKAKALNPVTHSVTSDFHWKALGFGTTFVVTPAGSSSIINGKFAYSKYNIDNTQLNGGAPRSSGIEGFEGGIDFTNFFPGHSQLKYGIEVSGLHTSLDYTNSIDAVTTLDRRNTLGSVYAVFRKNISEKFIFEPSVRLLYYSSLATFSPEPRLGLKYNASTNVRFKAAGGVYSQNIISTKSDRDIVNFFSGFILSPDQTVMNTDQQSVKTNLQRAYHALFGIEVDVQDVEFNLEPWYKNFNQNIELSRIKTYSQDGDFTAGNGQAYGIDLSARYNKKRIYLWGVASLQKITYNTLVREGNNTNGAIVTQEFAPPFDRRFNLNLVGAYTAGKNRDWELSARFNLGSPFPFTQTQE